MKTNSLALDDKGFRFPPEIIGAHAVLPVANAFWGERYGIFLDPFGHRWSVSTRLEDLSPTELQERAESYAAEQSEQEGSHEQ